MEEELEAARAAKGEEIKVDEAKVEGNEPEDFVAMGRQAFRDSIAERMGSLVGEEGLDIMTMGGHYNPERDEARFDTWWEGLNEEAKQEVRNYYMNDRYGGWGEAFDTYLQGIEEIPPK